MLLQALFAVQSTMHGMPAAQVIVPSHASLLAQSIRQAYPGGQVDPPTPRMTQIPPPHPPLQAAGHMTGGSASAVVPPSSSPGESPSPASMALESEPAPSMSAAPPSGSTMLSEGVDRHAPSMAAITITVSACPAADARLIDRV